MKAREVRLSWEETQKHYLALDAIEEKNAIFAEENTMKKVSNSLKKRMEAKTYNEKNQYLRDNGLIEKMGGFYKTIQDE